MKTIAIAFALWMTGLAAWPAQTFSTLRNFSTTLGTNGVDTGTNSDGVGPSADMILSGNTLYGTSANGGAFGSGTVFAANTDGTGFTNLYNFSALTPYGTNSDGAVPGSGLVWSGGALFGTAQYGGPAGNGVIFSVNTNGNLFSVLYNFSATDPAAGTNADGANPISELVSSGSILYGTTYRGGSSNYGTVFAINPNGSSFTNLHSFTASAGDGGYPSAGLILSGNTLYGTTTIGGSSSNGTVFSINTDGTGFALLHSFSAFGKASSTNSDGGFPGDRLLVAGGTLYGTAELGGSKGSGTVFSVNTDGTGFTNLHNFSALSIPVFGTNSDGAEPSGDLILSGNTLYGTASAGGSSYAGTVFGINTDGTDFNALYEFTAISNAAPYSNNDGGRPQGGLVFTDNTLYGTASGGGGGGDGTLFSISLASDIGPTLTIYLVQTNVVMQWATNFAGFTLQSSPQLGPAAAWNPAPLPLIVNGQNTVTVPISGSQAFYRLSQ